MLKIIIFILLYLFVGSIFSLLFYLYTEDDEIIGVWIIAWPPCLIVACFYILIEIIENIGDFINEKRENKEKDMWDTFTDDQKVYIEYLIGQTLNNNKEDE